jgi:hypothetical protein
LSKQAAMSFQGLTADEVGVAWEPLIGFTNSNSADYEGQNSLVVQVVPARLFWNAEVYRQFAPSAVNFDDRSGASPTDFLARRWRSGHRLGCEHPCSRRRTKAG